MDRKLKVLELFAGYGSQAIALKNIGIEIDEENSFISEWTADAIIAYASIHQPERMEAGIEWFNSGKGNEKLTKEILIDWLLDNFTISTEKKKVDGSYVPIDKKSYMRMKWDYLITLYVSIKVSNNLGSIMDIKGEQVKGMDLLTYSFPCQDLSIAGKGAGIKEGTRSGLLFQVERILEEQSFEDRPQVLLMENVKNLIGKNNKESFEIWCAKLRELGYENYYQVLNAKDYGVPQNRERVFMVSVKTLGTSTKATAYKIGDTIMSPLYTFPPKKELKLRLKDYLEKDVDESFYLSDEHIAKILGWKQEGQPLKQGMEVSNDTKEVEIVGNIKPSKFVQSGSVYNPNGSAPTFTENHGDVMKVLEKQPLKDCGKYYIPNDGKPDSQGNRIFKEDAETIGTLVAGAPYKVMEGEKENYIISTLRAGNGLQLVAIKVKETKNYYAYENSNGRFDSPRTRIHDISKHNVSRTITATDIPMVYMPLRIRKITPREAWRLMGVEDKHFDNVAKHLPSKGTLYKLAGNSIVVPVLEDIFRELYNV